MALQKKGVDAFDEMEAILMELYSRAVDYSDWDRTSLEKLRKYRLHVDAVFEQVKAGIHASCMDSFLKFIAKMRAFIGDYLFYDRHTTEESIAEYKAALAIDPFCQEALNGIVAAYLQGEDMRPQEALPYAKVRAQLDPQKKNDVSYIESLIEELEQNGQ